MVLSESREELKIKTSKPFNQTIYLKAISVGKVGSELLPIIVAVCGNEKVDSSPGVL